jgi:hypothetical protein
MTIVKKESEVTLPPNEGSAADAGVSHSVFHDQWPGPADFFR